MRKLEIKISKGQMLCDIMDSIKSNTIIEKTLCGIGATTLELKSERNSIIVEPNIPVITGKMQYYPTICGVYDGVTTKDITEYIKNQSGFKKIMTTPEGFIKIKSACRRLKINMWKEYFLLFDECEKLVQDIDYRKNISLPLKDFFKFDSKAIVSATPIIPSDPRFKEQDFIHIKVQPNYNYRSKLLLYQTNSPILLACFAIQQVLKKQKTVCVFFNTVKGISNIIEKLNIMGQSNIYCGKESAAELSKEGLTNVFSEIITDKNGFAQLNKCNFFTSRFYSAVDINLQYMPVVIIVSDAYSYPFTMVDPKTESIQIFGRFRNGVAKRVHITNYNYKLQIKTQSQLKAYLEGQHEIYSELYEKRCATIKAGEVDILDQALMSVDYARYVDENCSINHFMYDNAYADELTKGLYKNKAGIKKGYEDTLAYDVKYKYIPLSISNLERISLENKRLGKTDLNKLIFKLLKRLCRKDNQYKEFLLADLKKNFPLMCEAYKVLGEHELAQTDFSPKRISAALAKKKGLLKEMQKGIVSAIHNHFNEDAWYPTTEINTFIKTTYESFNITVDGRGCSNKIKLYYMAVEEHHRDKRGWKLGKKIVT